MKTWFEYKTTKIFNDFEFCDNFVSLPFHEKNFG